MSDLLIVVPSRGRPQNAVGFIKAFEESGAGADVLFGIDGDDPTAEDYPVPTDNVSFAYGPPMGMCGTLNSLAAFYAEDYRYIGFAGDDHRFRGENPCARITEALDDLGTGWVYGDDLFQRENLPTAWFCTSDIVRALGWMAPPAQKHLYLDDAILALGRATRCIRYLPDVVIEHVHPAAGKAPDDEHYQRVNSGEMYEHDEAAYLTWRADGFADAVAKVRALRAVRA